MLMSLRLPPDLRPRAHLLARLNSFYIDGWDLLCTGCWIYRMIFDSENWRFRSTRRTTFGGQMRWWRDVLVLSRVFLPLADRLVRSLCFYIRASALPYFCLQMIQDPLRSTSQKQQDSKT